MKAITPTPHFIVAMTTLLLMFFGLVGIAWADQATNQGQSDLRADPTAPTDLILVPLVTIAQDGKMSYDVIRVPDGKAEGVLPIVCFRHPGESTISCLLVGPKKMVLTVKLVLKTQET